MTYHIDFEPVGRRGPCPAGQSLLDCARQLGVDLVNLCGGAGTCGRCKVQVVDGRVSEITSNERELLTPQEVAEGYRLACRTTPLGDCKVRVPPGSLTAPQRTQVEGLEIAVSPEPPVRAYPVQMAPPSIETDDLRGDDERLLRALEEQHRVDGCAVDVAVLRDLSPRLRDGDWHVTAAVRDVGGKDVVGNDNEVVALLPASTRPLGFAVDLGTTKIAGYLVDLDTGRTLAARGKMNPQIAYGEDLVARMDCAERDPSEAVRLQELVVETLNQMTAELCAEVDAEPAAIVEAVVVGNTAMHHLFLRLPVGQLARAPYVPAVQSALDLKSRDVGLRIAPGAYVHLLPNVAGYVGADHVAMLLATGVGQAEGVVLALDIGTNTEVCLANHGRLTSVSCASGPAFEGAHIRHGMRAARGAIERVSLDADGRVAYQTIGGAPPVGICGSGILDCLAQLFHAGVLDARGRMVEHPGVRPYDESREFVLVGEEEQDGRPAITVTQKDVRELQLAKGAMRTGIEVLLEANGLSAGDIDKVIIAGAFGTYIDVASAVAIGMLPSVPLDRVEQVGNAAGAGARLALVSRAKRAEAQSIARRTGYIELATAPDFTRMFADSMYLGQR